MKSKILYFFLIISSIINCSYSQENYFNFEAQKIEVEKNGNIIKAINGKAISKNGNYEILADNFKYSNTSGILEVSGNASILIYKEKLDISFSKGLIDTNKSLIKAFGEVQFTNQNNNIKIETKIINFEYQKNILFSDSSSKIYDGNQNTLTVSKFKYEIQNDLLKIQNVNLIDRENNNLELSNAYLDTKKNILLGKDFYLKLNNKNFNYENEPRLRGSSIIDDEISSEIINGVFTTCKRTGSCPPWQLSAKKISHKKKKKIINYEDAVLKFYDFPVMYLPRFSHPDPTVKRQSGFLTPTIKSDRNNQNHLNLPYYMVISENKDATFHPRIYNDEKFLLQTEYRTVGKESKHISDFSFKIDDNKKFKNHFFYEYNKKFNIDNFINNDFVLKIQSTSKDTYLKKNKIKSEFFSTNNILENSVKFNFELDNSFVNFETLVYEDLNKEESDRYEYIFPRINFNKDLNNYKKMDGDFVLNSQFLNKKFNTNINETTNINDLKYKSLPTITKGGFYNNFEFLLKNSNSKAKNSTTFKNKENIYLSSLFQFNSTLPLKKESDEFTNILNPKLAFKIAPDFTKNQKDKDYTVDANNIFALNRIVDSSSIEGGISLTYGAEYKMKKISEEQDFFNFNIANNFRLKENDDLPKNSQFDEKISSILSEVSFSPNNIVKINYKNSLKNNFKNINYENFTTEFRINNLVTSFDYLNQNELSNNNSYLSNITEFQLDNKSSIIFSTRENKTLNITEYYKLSYQYKNDCLAASIEYDKDYYTDRDIRPNEGIFLRVTMQPFDKN
jgi:LPS-assembly protein